MCFLTYVPTEDHGFILTSNRDEHIDRAPAKPPRRLKIHTCEVFCPIDPISDGTWIATGSEYTLVILNGGFKKHMPNQRYRQSRGCIIPDFFKWNNPYLFSEKFDFNEMEPFTLIVFRNQNRSEIVEIRWCSGKKHVIPLSGEQARVWSSATLYDSVAEMKRKNWFFSYLQAHKDSISSENLLDFHNTNFSEDPYNSIKLKRENGIETVCISQIEIQPIRKRFYYHSLKTNNPAWYILY